jgi:hypothetical protein
MATSNYSVRNHRIGDFQEASDVGAFHVVDLFNAWLLSVFNALIMNVVHDLA